MRISDWSSDVCSSDLHGVEPCRPVVFPILGGHRPRWLRCAGGLGWREHGEAGPCLGGPHDLVMLGYDPFRPGGAPVRLLRRPTRSEEHTSELQSLMRISYAVFCLKKKNKHDKTPSTL